MCTHVRPPLPKISNDPHHARCGRGCKGSSLLHIGICRCLSSTLCRVVLGSVEVLLLVTSLWNSPQWGLPCVVRYVVAWYKRSCPSGGSLVGAAFRSLDDTASWSIGLAAQWLRAVSRGKQPGHLQDGKQRRALGDRPVIGLAT